MDISCNSCIIFYYTFFKDCSMSLHFVERAEALQLAQIWILAPLFTTCVTLGMWATFLCYWGNTREVGGWTSAGEMGVRGKGDSVLERRVKGVGRLVMGHSWVPKSHQVFQCSIFLLWVLVLKAPSCHQGDGRTLSPPQTFCAVRSQDQ